MYFFQLFSDYQMQQMSENFVDTFGFEDGAFNENADDDNNEMRRLTNVLSDEDATAAASDAIKRGQGIFEAICDQRFTSFPGIDPRHGILFILPSRGRCS